MSLTMTEPEVTVTLDLEPFWDESLTNVEVAEAIGINPRSVGNLRKGVESARFATLVKLARFFSQRTGKPVIVDDLFKVEE